MAAAAHNVVTIAEAAQAIGVGDATLWRWIRDGAPVARRGRRGRGAVTTLVDVEALRAWRATTDAPSSADASASPSVAALRELLAALPELAAEAAWETHRAAVGPHKRALAGELAAMTHRLIWAVSDRLEGAIAPMTEATEPERTKLLRQISHR